MFSIVAFTFLIPTSPKNTQLAFSTHPNQEQNSAVLGVADTNEEYIYVQISGAINKPQVAKLKKGARVFELIETSGGFTDDASTAYINKTLNLAKLVADGEKLYIPFSIEELEPDFQSKYTEISEGLLININTATKEQLITLPQVGASTADRIINYRAKNGLFKSIENLKNVSGIGDKTFEEIKDLITI